MKKTLFLTLALICHFALQAQTNIDPFSGAGRTGAVSFVIDNTVYVGLGTDGTSYYKDFWKYSIATDQWIQIADFPGDARAYSLGFTVNGKAYVGLGRYYVWSVADVFYQDFYSYDPANNTWTQLNDFDGGARTNAVCFTLNNIAYIGTGLNSSGTYANDFWKYDLGLDSWTQVSSSFTGDKRRSATAFTVNGKAYVSGGYYIDGGTTQLSDIQEFDPSTETWTEKVFADGINLSVNDATSFEHKGLGYICYGNKSNVVTYDPATGTIENLGNILTLEDRRSNPISFIIDSKVFFGLGYYSHDDGSVFGVDSYDNGIYPFSSLNKVEAYFDFDEETIYNVLDNSIQGTPHGTVFSQDNGILGSCREYAVTGDYVDLVDFQPESFTINIWYNTSDTTKAQRIFHKGARGGSSGQLFSYSLLYTAGKLRFSVGNNQGIGAINIYSTQKISDNTWYKITCTFDNSTKEGILYVNDILQGTAISVNAIIPTPQILQLSYYPNLTVDKQPVIGYLDELGLWDRTMTINEIKAITHPTLSPFPTAPTDILLSNNSVFENLPDGTVVGNLSSTDANAGATHTYELIESNIYPNNANFSINGTELRANVLDYESLTSHTIKIKTINNLSISFEKEFTISVTNDPADDDAPTDISLTNSTISENQLDGTVVGDLSSSDPNPAATHTYELVDGANYPGNSYFTINGAQLLANTLDYETMQSLTIRIKTTNDLTKSFEKEFTIGVINDITDDTPPTDISLSNSTITENLPNGTLVGNLSSTDDNVNTTQTYELVDEANYPDNVYFSINGTELLANTLDYETLRGFAIKIKSTNSSLLSFEKVFSIDVLNDASDDNLNTSLIAYYDFDVEIIYNTLDPRMQGTPYGTVFSQDNGILGSSREYVLSGDYVDLFDFEPASFTINVWYNTSDTSLAQRIFHKGARGGSDLQLFSYSLLYANGKLRFSVGDNQGAGAIKLYNTEKISENTWYKITCTFDNSTLEGKLYVNDILQESAISSNAIIQTDELLKLSYYPNIDANKQPVIGYIDELGLWNKALTLNEIKSITHPSSTVFPTAPTDVLLSNNTITENQPNGTLVGNLSSTDANVGATHTYDLVDEANYPDNANFSINGNELLANTQDYETLRGLSIKIKSTNNSSISYEKELSINVLNDASDDNINTSLVAYYDFDIETIYNILDPQMVGIHYGTIFSQDNGILESCREYAVSGDYVDLFDFEPASFTINIWYNTSDTSQAQRIYHKGARGGSSFQLFSYSLLYANGKLRFTVGDNQGTGAINLYNTEKISENTWYKITCTFDNSTLEGKLYVNDILQESAVSGNAIIPTSELLKLSYYPNIDVNKQAVIGYLDELGLWNKAMTIEEIKAITHPSLTVFPTAPSDILLSNNTITENQTIGTLVGNLSSTDANIGATHTYELVDEANYPDNAYFSINGSELIANTLDYETLKNLSIRIKSTNNSYLSFEKVISIEVLNDESDDNISPSLVAYYDFDVETIYNILDPQMVGIPYGTVFSQDNGILGSSREYAVSGDYVDLFDFEPASFTINVWYNTSDTSQAQRIFHKGARGGSDLQLFSYSLLYANGKLRFSVGDNQGTGALNLYNTEKISENTWYKITCTFDNSTLEGKLYVNDILQESAISNNAIIQTAEVLKLSYYPNIDVNKQAVIGFLDELGLWDKALLIEDIKAITHPSSTVFPTAPSDVLLSNNTIAENMPNGTVVGNLSSTDDNSEATHTYELIENENYPNNSYFSINGTELSANALDFETAESHTIKVKTTNNFALSFEKEITINVLNDAGDDKTGFDQVKLDGFKFFPNPVVSVLYFSYSNELKIEKLEIISAHGKSLIHTEYKNSIDLSALPASNYYLKVITKERVYVYNLIVQ